LKEDGLLLYESYQKVPVYYVFQIKTSHQDLEKLINVGNDALKNAIKDYDSASKITFLPYLWSMIEKTITDYIETSKVDFTVPKILADSIRLLAEAKQRTFDKKLKLGDKHKATMKTIADEAGFSIELTKETLIYTMIPVDSAMYKTKTRKQKVKECILISTERRALELFYGAYGKKRHSVREIGDLLSASEEMVRQWINLGLRKLLSNL
jgi:RNA polymerase sigma factor (sigma-70 family)